jgi:heme-degrading monooxygenase HmoA
MPRGGKAVGYCREALPERFSPAKMWFDTLLDVRRSNRRVMPASSPSLASTPEPPYYAVIFTSLRTDGDRGYGEMAERMADLAATQPGFLGVESARGSDGLGITVSYWASEEAITAWKAHMEHKPAQEGGKRVWYADYQVRVAKVERGYGKL